MLLVAWLIGSALAGTTLPTLGKEVRSSKVLLGVSRALPAEADTWFTDFTSVLAQNGFPQVFSPFSNEPITDVRPPDPALAEQPGGHRAQRSIVKVMGTAPSCGKVLEGTGFVFARRRVMTNAHVVGGVDEPDRPDRRRGPAVRRDGRALRLGARHRRAGRAGPRRARAAVRRPRTRAAATARSSPASRRTARTTSAPPASATASRPTARTSTTAATVRRDVYSLYATVRQGNSGGPLLTTDGKVYGVVFAKSLDDADTGYALTADEVQPGHRRGAHARTSRWTATAARSEPGAEGRGVSRGDGAAGPRPSGPGGAGCAESPTPQDPSPVKLRGDPSAGAQAVAERRLRAASL